ncbi:hypothetical protein scyTo_0017801, partial [Scyliorhinus torazame]|nr:hypothetical protein [Scyliorhinus torazame]
MRTACSESPGVARASPATGGCQSQHPGQDGAGALCAMSERVHGQSADACQEFSQSRPDILDPIFEVEPAYDRLVKLIN